MTEQGAVMGGEGRGRDHRPRRHRGQGQDRGAHQGIRGPLFVAVRRRAPRGTIDDVIMPHATRRRLARALLKNKHVEMPARKHDKLPV
jgi:propionyl-CoA carboxylase beta subunit